MRASTGLGAVPGAGSVAQPRPPASVTASATVCPAALPSLFHPRCQGGESVSGRRAASSCTHSWPCAPRSLLAVPRRGPAPCRITNTAKEVYQALGKDINENRIDSYETLLPGGERGVLESHVTRTFLEAMNEDEVDLQETEFWFNPTKDDYEDDSVSLPAEEVEPTFPEPYHADQQDGLVFEDDTGQLVMAERIPLDLLQEAFQGETLTGFVTDIWLYHGLQVDVGAKYDGLIPITVQDFERVAEHFEPGQKVEVQICSMKRPGLYRWPLVLRLMDPELAPQIMDPDAYHHPINHGWAYAQGWELQDLLRETNRTYEPTSVYMKEDDALTAMAIQEALGAGNPQYTDAARQNPDVIELQGFRQPQLDDTAQRVANI